ncbi:lytic transglycosylase domain-containing protein [Paenibacillus vandeheii]|uniref:lytic transglycosylase domain-containing protein n=1 Tax=Paenibacillus vandeheii TaxID=3035917 RepID=UPI003F4D7E67
MAKHSKTYEFSPYTILAMIQVETSSTFNSNLVGTHGDTGLLQVLPATQRYMKIKGSLKNPSVNIEIGAKYLAYTQKRFGNDLGIVACTIRARATLNGECTTLNICQK